MTAAMSLPTVLNLWDLVSLKQFVYIGMQYVTLGSECQIPLHSM